MLEVVPDPFAKIFANEKPVNLETAAPSSVSAPPPVSAHPVVPAMAISGLTVQLATPAERAQSLQSAIADLQVLAASYDAIRAKIDHLYGELAHAAQERAGIDHFNGLLDSLQAARKDVGPESDLARRALHVKDTAAAFYELIRQV